MTEQLDSGGDLGPWTSRAQGLRERCALGEDGDWGSRDLLRILDERLSSRPEGGEAVPAEEDLDLAAALALGAALTRELTLDWLARTAEDDAEPALRFADSEVVLYPLRMLAAHLAGARRDGTPIRLERLVESTAGYLDHLVRYFPSRLGLSRRSRGARRAPA